MQNPKDTPARVAVAPRTSSAAPAPSPTAQNVQVRPRVREQIEPSPSPTGPALYPRDIGRAPKIGAQPRPRPHPSPTQAAVPTVQPSPSPVAVSPVKPVQQPPPQQSPVGLVAPAQPTQQSVQQPTQSSPQPSPSPSQPVQPVQQPVQQSRPRPPAARNISHDVAAMLAAADAIDDVPENAIPGTTLDSKFAAMSHRKTYAQDQIDEILSDGYIRLHPDIWGYLCQGSKISYYKKSGGPPREKRFRYGGFVRYKYKCADDTWVLQLENIPTSRRKHAKFEYVTWPVKLSDVEEIWKQYDECAFIEIHMICNSLAVKQRQIEELSARLGALEDAFRSLRPAANSLFNHK